MIADCVTATSRERATTTRPRESALRAILARGDEYFPVCGPAAASQYLQPRIDRWGQAQRIDIQPHLHRRSDLVDILPAGPRGADECFFKLIFINLNAITDPDHARIIADLSKEITATARSRFE